ncbi:CDP-diacylglycerol--serine O-phosphatidyltransferase [Bacillus ginsengihumi]|uniref:CDP-diacylglycerol--serine O-phosphatidyltransferase n=1 Tax=Heyndrickxia ginsengihumi TaxID=363870 RepID=A0A6M0P4W3_9BACI|nr:CDP-diacylglycerol--serine O-phosphatidyltransferase [Heyndrickxia ginsengihumi]MBE6183715.1 CDP-diacylglycerol--serine O-phosphatidyltransferase [Bacillus sp. (in: firmicutes)]NEY19742.1 CDP-diacylglycerol--serine O-phosphatidyltransferase [Heyndrickxia ginsengihumi]
MFSYELFDETIKKLKAHSANCLTIINVCLGIVSILFSVKNLHLAVVLVLIAALIDGFDGKVARKLNIHSDFGKQLDSLCDIVSFGTAPAIIMYHGIFHQFNLLGIFFILFYIVCGTIRLARFNIMEFSGHYTGLPITAAGVVLCVSYTGIPYLPSIFFFILIFLLSIFMVSTFKFKKL